MSDKILVLIIILVFVLILKQNIDCVFVSVGDYPDYRKYGINLPECGRSHGIEVYNISYQDKCFGQSYDKLWSISGRHPNDNDVRRRIANGNDAENGEAPFTLYLPLVKGGRIVSSCTGILVTLNWVLTAAHCLKGDKDYVVIRAGSKIGERRSINPNNWFTHPDYKYTYFNGSHDIIDYRSENDIALLKLSEHYSTFVHNGRYLINTICLPKASDVNTENDLAIYFGYGRINNYIVAERLQKGVANIIPFGNCFGAESMFCADTLERSSKICEGDSGGPLIQYSENGVIAVLVAVNKGASPKNATCEVSTRSYWVSVPLHINWIFNTIINNNSND